MAERNFQYNKTFRYEFLKSGIDSDAVIYVLHGYGQLAKYFIQKFKLITDHFHVIAPEGMHRFYLNGTSGRVGASWMTKEARESDIKDNLAWLNALDEQISHEFSIKKRYLLGFSQGGATAARWYEAEKDKFDSIILWASVFPPDIEKPHKISDSKKAWFVIGSEDEYFDKEIQNEMIQFYQSIGYSVEEYEGGHSIDDKTLKKILSIN